MTHPEFLDGARARLLSCALALGMLGSPGLVAAEDAHDRCYERCIEAQRKCTADCGEGTGECRARCSRQGYDCRKSCSREHGVPFPEDRIPEPKDSQQNPVEPS